MKTVNGSNKMPGANNASIIIPTYNRPGDLETTVASILRQTVSPREIIVVDDGDLGEPPLRSRALRQGVHYLYIKKPRGMRGLTRSRNLGVEKASGDIIFFFDDDVELFDDFLENALAVYEKFPRVSGIGGGEVFNQPDTMSARLWFIYDVLFCMNGFKKGFFLPSCFSTNMGTPVLKTRFSRVEFLGGASFSFRRDVFDKYRFSEEFDGYGLGEDKEFSYRVSRDHLLVSTPQAKLYHYESPVMRYQKFQKARAKIISKYVFLTQCNVKGRFKGFWFCYAMAGYLLKRTIIMLLSFDRGEVDRVRGILSGFREILTMHRKRP